MAAVTERKRQTQQISAEEIPVRRTSDYISIYANYANVSSIMRNIRISFFEITDEDENKDEHALIREKKTTISMPLECAQHLFVLLGGAVAEQLPEEEQEIVEAAQEVISNLAEKHAKDD